MREAMEAMPKRGYRSFPYIDLLKFVRVYQGDPRSFRLNAAGIFDCDVRTIERHLPKLVTIGALKYTSHGSSHLHEYRLTPWGDALVDDQLLIESGTFVPDFGFEAPELRIYRDMKTTRARRSS